ncbi:bifunctional folylpolyglutamate synthase/dihydrofolate synthase [Lactobacillus sp. LC28-10]|uniref:tetrahydrofolate synthase n=1 Tax=Secundilactobacillus angelensis TaxID=2722706 RepID=A0ABX1KWZ9_9LACO|nr:folylpolyglutamate synthase/dihydrofolate synthase family protein [Secundilactobacillus angelensis]MCH5462067.1 bifunctional folylpolyglutamate synthase/dihydrofolate synthase [Secundilactobacillus angelensis]NLR18452.1 bifunctional folylpolyglutamate synthase/dihydrofolate synthase [Secundilactobacillus angelensis]
MVENYDDALSFIHGRTKFKKSDHLNRMRQFLELLGNPQKELSAIHVAGTNGKGSTVAYLRDLLMSQGYTVGTFTSPFLIRFNERISVDGEPISDSELIKLVNRVQPVVADLDAHYPEGGPTEFEIITAMMFLYFKSQVDVAVIEVGIGGLLDSTNVFTPVVSVITTIGFDHMKILGNTLPEIAAQKAGIIKQGVPVVAGRLPESAMQVVETTAAKNNSPLYRVGYEVTTKIKSETGWQEKFDYQFGDQQFKGLTISMLGDYQVDNASCALTAFIIYQTQRHQIVRSADITRSLAKTVWAGRFEPLNQEPLIVIDGAHNEPAIEELRALLKQRFSENEIYVLFSVLADKQHDKMLATLRTVPNLHIILTTFQGPGTRAVTDPKALAAQYDEDDRIEVIDNWQMAIGVILQRMSAEDLFLITGSLYFISDVRAFFEEP